MPIVRNSKLKLKVGGTGVSVFSTGASKERKVLYVQYMHTQLISHLFSILHSHTQLAHTHTPLFCLAYLNAKERPVYSE